MHGGPAAAKPNNHFTCFLLLPDKLSNMYCQYMLPVDSTC